MSGATPTLIPRDPRFPRLLPKPPQPHLVPLRKDRLYEHMNASRDIQREMDELSEEENELEELVRSFCLFIRFTVHEIVMTEQCCP